MTTERLDGCEHGQGRDLTGDRNHVPRHGSIVRSAGCFRGTGILLRAHLHSGWRALVGWVAVLAGLVVGTAFGISAAYPTPADREAYAATAGASPYVAAFNGRGYDLTQLGGITAYEVGFMALIGIPIVALHLAIRFGRHEEDAGRTELVTAGRVGRLAPVAAAALVLAVAVAGFVGASGLGLQAAGLPARGSWLYAAGLGLFMAVCGGVGLLVAEVSREARTAYGIGLALVFAAFLRRAVADARDLDVSWAGPTGWLAEIRPWGSEVRWWPLAAYGAAALAAWGLAAAVAARRDLGGGLIATRPGPAYGGALLGSPAGLAWRFARPAGLGWLIGTAGWSAALGGLANEMTQIVRNNPAMLAALAVDRPEDLVTSLALVLCAIGSAACGVQVMTRLAREEAAGRLGLLLSTPTGRLRAWLSWLAVALAGTATILLASALALGLGSAWSTGNRDNIAVAAGAGVDLLAPVLLIVAVAAVLQAVAPRWAALAWVLVGWATIVGMLAEPLRLPEWSRNVSPLYAVGQVPIEHPDTTALVVIGLLAVGCTVSGMARFRVRELLAG